MKQPVFTLHARLQQDCIDLGRFRLCRLLLMNDCHYPWFILVPERAGVTEIFQLSEEEQRQLLRESSFLAKTLSAAFNADKMNIAAIGNLVPQLHIHHIVRYQNDIAWPAPVWGFAPATPYNEADLAVIQTRAALALAEFLNPLLNIGGAAGA